MTHEHPSIARGALLRTTLWLTSLACGACGGVVTPSSSESSNVRDPAEEPHGEVVAVLTAAPNQAKPDSLEVAAPAEAQPAPACASCPGSLDDACADGACPPPLYTSEFLAWCASAKDPSLNLKVRAVACGSLEVIHVGVGVDCGGEYAFDKASGALVGVVPIRCTLPSPPSCKAAAVSACIPPCCLDGSCVTPAADPCP
jgi:hypothetical protein